ncbi:MAG: hypothetical protein K2O36_02285, partial [Ruminococcus sp.]|nr:hypothetical protein [Ruminococcus sp.]
GRVNKRPASDTFSFYMMSFLRYEEIEMLIKQGITLLYPLKQDRRRGTPIFRSPVVSPCSTYYYGI